MFSHTASVRDRKSMIGKNKWIINSLINSFIKKRSGQHSDVAVHLPTAHKQ